MFVTHLESALDGTRFEPNQVLTVHQGRPLWVRYDLPAIQRAVAAAAMASAAHRLCQPASHTRPAMAQAAMAAEADSIMHRLQ